MKKLTTEEFVKKAKEKHGDKYDYTKTVYINAKTDVTITCPIHGDFEIKPYNHLSGTGCVECKRRKWTTDRFIEEAKKVHGDKYDYSKTEYKGTRVKVCIISHEKDKDGNEIGEMWQYPMAHLSGSVSHKEHYGYKKDNAWETRVCPICGKTFEVRKKYKKICCSAECREKYIKEHKDETNRKRSVSVKKAFEKKTKKDWDISVEKARKTCLAKYGEDNFSKTKLGREICSRNMKTNKKDFDEKYRKEVLIPKYKEICEKDDLELLEFRSRFDCDVKCKKCGNIFNVKVLGYLTSGTTQNLCRICHPVETPLGPTSFENTFEDFIKKTGLRYLKNYRKAIYPREIDFYFPDLRVGFELDGLYWHCETQKENDYHLSKTEECEKKGIRLIHIFEDEWRDKRDICESRVKNILGLTDVKIGARKCIIKNINKDEEREFLEKNHIQGYVASKKCYGLFYGEELLAVMSFGGLRKSLGYTQHDNKYELLRFANKCGCSVVGGADRLFKHFIEEVKPLSVISYADRRWSRGNMYEKIGMTFLANTKPNYFYLIAGKRKNRFSFRKNILVEKYGCPKDMTEKEFCFSQHWYRIYDCGSKFYKWEAK